MFFFHIWCIFDRKVVLQIIYHFFKAFSKYFIDFRAKIDVCLKFCFKSRSYVDRKLWVLKVKKFFIITNILILDKFLQSEIICFCSNSSFKILCECLFLCVNLNFTKTSRLEKQLCHFEDQGYKTKKIYQNFWIFFPAVFVLLRVFLERDVSSVFTLCFRRISVMDFCCY